MFEFFDTTIGEQLTLQRGFDITKKQQILGHIPVVSSGGIASFHNEAKVKGPGVVLGRKGTLGTVFYINGDFWPHDTSLWVKDFKENNPHFVYYFFRSISDTLRKMDVGAANPALNRNHVHPLEVKWPIKKVQNSIVKVLSELDQKIQINKQINETLEEITRTLFKSWFIDFEPTRAKIAAKQNGEDPELAAMAAVSGKSIEAIEKLNLEHLTKLKDTAALFPDSLVETELGEVPEGWEITQLGKIIEFNPRRTLKKGQLAPYLDMKNVPTKGHLAKDVYEREMASGTKFINGDTLLARITPCLENGKTAYVDFLKQGQVGWGSTEYIVMRPRDGRPLSLGYVLARLESFRNRAIQTMTGTSGRQRANAKALSELPWLNYPKELLDLFDVHASGYLKQARINGDENQSLVELRDSLLSRLLSGELLTGDNA